MTLGILQVMVLVFRLLVPVAIALIVGWAAWHANKRNKNAIVWGITAGAAFFIPYKLLRTFLSSELEDVRQSSDNILGLVAAYHLPPIAAGTLFGLLAVWLLKSRTDKS